MSTQHLLPVLDTCESFQSSVWHFGSTWQTEDTICMKFTYIKVGGDHETPFGRKARKSSCGWVFLKLKGLVMDGKQDFLVLRRKKFCDLEPLWIAGYGNADNFQRQIDCTPIMLLTLGLMSSWDFRGKKSIRRLRVLIFKKTDRDMSCKYLLLERNIQTTARKTINSH